MALVTNLPIAWGSAFGDICALSSPFLVVACVPAVVCVARKLQPCLSYSRRGDRIHSVLLRSLDKGGGGRGTSSVAAKGACGNVTEERFVLTFAALRGFATWCPAACRAAFNSRVRWRGEELSCGFSCWSRLTRHMVLPMKPRANVRGTPRARARAIPVNLMSEVARTFCDLSDAE